ncbi:hypothetical protein NCCP2140_30190 [Pseudoalteromonas sp. NCCP-2140]|uniref:hypothetical protein n=1 Tax=Pseudoalteromonas sp. NCCP-2140 TaxID=2942288 RepID=UPI00203FA768|nr:hypothetical protein [Pseudoalteromonas sp. NCCP-2140]GKW53966.1 hypothetical protein NCCP2140_30190 [Pseudoalteromonas sp. NCCP-2140]
MKVFTVLIALLMFTGCASQAVKDGSANEIYAEHECLGGELETDYSYTIFSTDDDDSNKGSVKSTCHPVKTESEFERDLRTGG